MQADSIPGKIAYEPVGLTRTATFPDGFRRVECETLVGYGEQTFALVQRALFTWNLHRRAGLQVSATSNRAAVGVRVRSTLGVGFPSGGTIGIKAPCEVVWAGSEELQQRTGGRSFGFGYGTLTGHPERGEECFVVRLSAEGA